jgi:hypothetical protein
LGEESDGGHLTRKKRISVISIKHAVEFCDQHHKRDEARRIAANIAKLPECCARNEALLPLLSLGAAFTQIQARSRLRNM